jgi:hypothetical protein
MAINAVTFLVAKHLADLARHNSPAIRAIPNTAWALLILVIIAPEIAWVASPPIVRFPFVTVATQHNVRSIYPFNTLSMSVSVPPWRRPLTRNAARNRQTSPSNSLNAPSLTPLPKWQATC